MLPFGRVGKYTRNQPGRRERTRNDIGVPFSSRRGSLSSGRFACGVANTPTRALRAYATTLIPSRRHARAYARWFCVGRRGFALTRGCGAFGFCFGTAAFGFAGFCALGFGFARC